MPLPASDSALIRSGKNVAFPSGMSILSTDAREALDDLVAEASLSVIAFNCVDRKTTLPASAVRWVAALVAAASASTPTATDGRRPARADSEAWSTPFSTDARKDRRIARVGE